MYKSIKKVKSEKEL